MATSEEAARLNMEEVMADFPFARASMEARNAEMRAAGFVFHGCASEAPSEMSEAEARRVAKAWMKRFEHGPEGHHFVGCGHAPSMGEMRRAGF